MISHMKRLSIASVAALVGVSVATGLMPAVSLAANGLCVNTDGTGGCYKSIQAAVNAATAGATISVAAGHFTGNVSISGKPLSLIGDGYDRTFISGPHCSGNTCTAIVPEPAVLIAHVHTHTEVYGFTIQNAALQGVEVRSSSNVLVTHDRLIHNDLNLNAKDGTCAGALPLDQDDCGEAINLSGATDSTIRDNVIGGDSPAQANAGGILLSDEYGATHDNRIVDNEVMNNIADCGITLASHPLGIGKEGPFGGAFGVYRNTVEDNVSSGNGGAGVGIFVPTPGTKAYDNTVFRNIIVYNGLAGIMMHSHAPQQNLNGNKLEENYIGPNNLLGDSDSGNMATTGILIWSGAKAGAAPIENTVITGNKILGNNHFGIWLVHTKNTRIGRNAILATIPIFKSGT